MNTKFRWPGLLLLGVLSLAVCVLYGRTSAQQRISAEMLPNPTAQRAELVRELAEIKQLLREQNELLRSGKMKVTFVPNTN